MEYTSILIGIVVLFILNRLLLAPLRHLIVNVVSGLVVFWLINAFGAAFGLHTVPVTWVTGLLVGIFGLPGVLAVTAFYTFF